MGYLVRTITAMQLRLGDVVIPDKGPRQHVTLHRIQGAHPVVAVQYAGGDESVIRVGSAALVPVSCGRSQSGLGGMRRPGPRPGISAGGCRSRTSRCGRIGGIPDGDAPGAVTAREKTEGPNPVTGRRSPGAGYDRVQPLYTEAQIRWYNSPGLSGLHSRQAIRSNSKSERRPTSTWPLRH